MNNTVLMVIGLAAAAVLGYLIGKTEEKHREFEVTKGPGVDELVAKKKQEKS